MSLPFHLFLKELENKEVQNCDYKLLGSFRAGTSAKVSNVQKNLE